MAICLFFTLNLIAIDFYVAKDGDDSNPGTSESPFLTIAKASSEMVAGDACLISEGSYHETIRPLSNGVNYRSNGDAEVIISGFDTITSWTLHEGSIYVADIFNDLGDQNQLMYNSEHMNLARWPNKINFNPFDLEAYAASGNSSSISYGSIPNWNWEDGGVVFFLGRSRWTSWRQPITGAATGRVNFATLSDDWQFGGSHNPSNGGEFFLQNIYEALDADGEWYVDRALDKIYFQAPEGEDPNFGEALVKSRSTAIDLSERSNITIEGLNLIGGNIDLSSAENCIIRYCKILWGNHTIASTSAAFVGNASIELSSNSANNTIEYNNIQWGAANGIVIKGTNNQIQENYIGNFNYLGSYASPVELRGTNNLVRNEIFNGGRDGVRGGGSGSDVGYNDIHHTNLINDDCGAIYMCCNNYSSTRIHHNWIHDITSRNNNYNSYKATGVYLDNTTQDVIVDHNVMWNLEWACIQINWAGEDLLIYNNTLWSNSAGSSSSMGRWVNGYEFTNVQVYNTLANNGEFHYTDLQSTCILGLNDDPFEGYSSYNFEPKAGSCPVDAGREIEGYTDGYVGSAPDRGAYERGGELWRAGPSWSLEGDSSVDSIVFSSPPEVLDASKSYAISLDYFASTARDISVLLKDGDGMQLGESVRTVFTDQGQLSMEVNLLEMPVGGDNYTFIAEVRPIGSGTDENVYRDSIEVEILAPIPPESFSIEPTDSIVMEINTSRLFDFTIMPENATAGLNWKSSDEMILTVNDAGAANAVTLGEAFVIATTYNGLSDSCKIVVIESLDSKFVDKTDWEVIYVDSESPLGESKEDAIDMDTETFWHTVWQTSQPPLPHEIQIDMQYVYSMTDVFYLPRQDEWGPNGTIGEYELYLGNDPNSWDDPIVESMFSYPGTSNEALKTRNQINLSNVTSGRYLRLVALTEIQNRPEVPFTAVAELDIILDGLKPPILSADVTENVIGNDIEVSFTSDEVWLEAVEQVSIDENELTTADYSLSEGILTIPSSSFSESGEFLIQVEAEDYHVAQVRQLIEGQEPDNLASNIASEIRVYPNPVVDKVFIEGISNRFIKRITLFDMTGNSVLMVDGSMDKKTLNISHLENGSYYLVIDAESGREISQITILR